MIPALACLVFLAAAMSSDTRAQGTDADVLAARDAAQKGQWKALDTLRRKLAGHPLEAYPTYWALAPNLDRTDPTEVRGFLERYPRGPLAETVRRDWLRALGAAGSHAIVRFASRRLPAASSLRMRSHASVSPRRPAATAAENAGSHEAGASRACRKSARASPATSRSSRASRSWSA